MTIFRNLDWKDILIHAAAGFIAFLFGWPLLFACARPSILAPALYFILGAIA